jgi:hypothetical protein
VIVGFVDIDRIVDHHCLSFLSDGQQFYQYQQNKQSPLTLRKFKQWWSTILLITTKPTYHLSPKESLNSDGQQF